MIPPTSAIRASILSGLIAIPYLSSVSAGSIPLQHRAPHVISDSPSETAQAAGASITAVSKCHLHDGVQFCQAGATEFRVEGTATASSFTGCHAHGAKTACWAPNKSAEVEIYLAASATPTPTQGASAAASSVTAITGCHFHDANLVCAAGTVEYKVDVSATATQDVPAAYTGCHGHSDGAELHCNDPNGNEVTATVFTEDGDDEHSEAGTGGQNCHFHAGVEHCTGSSGEKMQTCERVQRDYNVKLRVGLLFVMLVTSSIGVFTPILMSSFVSPKHIVFTILRQFGTGVIISTAFVHLYTHAVLMFQNECLGDLGYESTASAILMAGIFLSFLVEYLGVRFMQWHQAKARARNPETAAAAPAPKTDMVNIAVLEAGVIFHSLLIGLTLVVAGDAFFGTLFAVIVFHQMFEGLALGTRIAALGREDSSAAGHVHSHGHGGHHAPAHPHYHPEPKPAEQIATVGEPLPAPHASKGKGEASGDESDGSPTPGESVMHVSMRKKLLLALAFALVTPIGMAIGIGALHEFNGNDPSTVIAIGTLDAFSAGILVWVGIVEMWAHDWMLGGEMTNSSFGKTTAGMIAIMLGMGVMSLLGKWA